MIKKKDTSKPAGKKEEKDFIIPRPEKVKPKAISESKQSSAVFEYDTDKFKLVTPSIKNPMDLKK